ncbi:MAG TPA: methyltransferase domain-containing protein [Rhizomicrobium sp.]|jgi:protein-L-isoaspartate(D-aspartate) O-methyltransferase|nr:methyltransferase domain-containing protein [Rhizomicrobium sp.]
MSTVEEARKWFTEDLRVAAGVRSRAVMDAFATVPRERFIGPAPWRVGLRLMKMGANPFVYETFAGDDPRVLYHDLVVALDEEKEINNGQPSLWARIFDDVDPRPGERLLHIGCGTGYYSAILAETVGEDGSVFAVDVNTALIHRARAALSPWRNVTAVCGDGAKLDGKSYDLIVVSAGLTHPLGAWLDGLTPDGRLVFPLTAGRPGVHHGSGAMLLVSRASAATFAARFLGPAGFIHFEGGRDQTANERFIEALRTRPNGAGDVRSLRRDSHDVTETCWVHCDGYCLSSEPP